MPRQTSRVRLAALAVLFVGPLTTWLAQAAPIPRNGPEPVPNKEPQQPPAVPGTPLQVIKGHSKGIFHVACSPDGKLLATGSRDHTARIWELATGKELHVLTDHTQDVHSSAFSPDRK